MLAWTTLNEDALVNYLAHDQMELLRTKQMGKNRDPLEVIVKDVTAYLRTFVPLQWLEGAPSKESIPQACKIWACFLVIEALQARIPELHLSTDQIRNANNARMSLERLSECWHTQVEGQVRRHRLEAVHHRKSEASTKTLRGL